MCNTSSQLLDILILDIIVKNNDCELCAIAITELWYGHMSELLLKNDFLISDGQVSDANLNYFKVNFCLSLYFLLASSSSADFLLLPYWF